MKEKKITVKPFLNRHLSPLNDKKTGSKLFEIEYPLYYQVTYERKNTQIKSYYNKYYGSLEEANREDADMLKLECDILKRTVAYEKKRLGNEFSLTGLKDKYEIFVQPLECVFESYLRKKLMKVYVQSHSEFQPIIRFDGFEVNFSLLLKASKLLITEFKKYLSDEYKNEIEAYTNYIQVMPPKYWPYKFVTLMDWMDGNYRIELKNKLLEHFADKRPSPEKTITILNSIVDERIFFL